MTNNDDLALSRKEFEAFYNETHSVQVTPQFKRFGYYISPTMQKAWELWQQARQSLLAERDADKKRIAELEKKEVFLKERLAQLANFNPDWDMLEAATDSLREHAAELTSANQRIAGLEASHVKLRESMAAIHNTIRMDGAGVSLSVLFLASKRAYEESAAAAGVNLEVEE